MRLFVDGPWSPRRRDNHERPRLSELTMLRILGILLIALMAITIGALTAYRQLSPAPEPLSATVLPAPTQVPDFSLLDHTGQSIGKEVFQGQWDLVFFGFTHCPDICPWTLQILTSVHARLADDGQEPLPRIVLVSVDPERDTPEHLARYLGSFDDDILGITGDLDEIRRLTTGLGIFFEKTTGGDGDYNVDHSAAVLLIDPRGEFSVLFKPPHDIENLVRDLPRIIGRV